MTDYRYRHFTYRTMIEDLQFAPDAPPPGAPFPDFELPTTDGGRVSKGDFLGKRPMLMVAASIT